MYVCVHYNNPNNPSRASSGIHLSDEQREVVMTLQYQIATLEAMFTRSLAGPSPHSHHTAITAIRAIRVTRANELTLINISSLCYQDASHMITLITLCAGDNVGAPPSLDSYNLPPKHLPKVISRQKVQNNDENHYLPAQTEILHQPSGGFNDYSDFPRAIQGQLRRFLTLITLIIL